MYHSIESRACTSTHLGTLNMVVQVITEGVDEVDGVVSGVGISMAREQDCKDDDIMFDLNTRESLSASALLI